MEVLEARIDCVFDKVYDRYAYTLWVLTHAGDLVEKLYISSSVVEDMTTSVLHAYVQRTLLTRMVEFLVKDIISRGEA